MSRSIETPSREHRSLSLPTLAAAIGMLLANPATAVDLEQKIDFDIPAQDLGGALVQFSQQARVQIIVSEDIRGETTPGITRRHTIKEALGRLLAPAGLSYEVASEDSITVAKAERKSDAGAANVGTGSMRLAQQPAAESLDESSPRQASASAVAEDASITSLEEVTVTGSRLERPAFDMPTPVTVLNSAQIERSGRTNILDILERLPAVGLGAGLSAVQSTDDAGASFANLRSLGTARTLTLINGRRRVAGSSDSAAIDLSTIPASMIERVELITGGASAVYGADAVSGVINVILKHDFSGLEFSGQGGWSEHGGAESAAASLLGGGSFANDRGNFTFGVSHVRDEPLFSDERSFTRSWINFDVNPESTGPEDGIPDLITVRDYRLPSLHPGGAFFIGDGLYTVDPQLRTVAGADGWDFTPYFQQRMRAETTSVRANLNYKLGKSVEFIMESEFATGSSYSGGAPNYDFETLLQRDNPYIPDDLGAMMDAEGLTELGVSRASTDQGIRDDDNSRDTYSVLAGLQGSFGNEWKWQTFAQYGEYKLTSRETNQRITSRFLEAIDVISDPLTGDPVCRNEAARAAGCQPLNILGQNVANDAALAYFRTDRTLRVTNTQALAGAQLTGALFDLPAGALASAVGVEYRKDTRSYKDDPLAELGLLSDKAAGTSLTGEDSVSEAFVEVVVPLLRDKPFARVLSVEGAVRVSDYDSIGSTTAWKYGGSWAPVTSLRLRATASRSVRAPNLYELFAPRQISQINIFDPCELSQIGSQPNRAANCRALGVPEGWEGPAGVGELAIFDTVGGGNRALDPETSDAWTVGFVFTPEALPELSIAVDYWSIEIEDAVQPLDVTAIVEKCVDSATIDNVFCPRVTRGADSTIELVDYSIINVGKLSTDGLDIQVAYTFEPAAHGLGIPGRFTAALNASYLRSLEELIDSSDPASLLLRRGEYNTPAWRGTVSLGYAHRAVTVDLATRVIGKARIDMNSTLETYDQPRVSERVYNDLAVGYTIGAGYNLRLSVNNLFDVEPPPNPYTYLGSNASLYDSIGRYFVLGGTARF